MQINYRNNIQNTLLINSRFLKMTDGERVREVRGRMTIEEFIEPLGVKVSNISNIENGRSGLSIGLAKKIAVAYSVSLDWLLLEKGSPKLMEPRANYGSSTTIEIDKDELIELQRLALKNTIKEKDSQIEQLKNS